MLGTWQLKDFDPGDGVAQKAFESSATAEGWIDVAVPGGTIDADSNKLVPGSAEVDQSFLEAQIKRAASVKAHFAEGRLQVIKPQPKSEKPPQE